MIKIISGKDILKILLGFVIIHAIFDIYCTISNYLPPIPSSPFGLPEFKFTMLMNYLLLILCLIITGILAHYLFLRKGSERINQKDIFKMLIGTLVIGVLLGNAIGSRLLMGISLVLILIFVYLSFLRK